MNSRNDSADSIREINLSYIMLAQRLLRADRTDGGARLGLSSEVGDILVNLSMAQVVKLAASSHLLCAFRFDSHSMLSALTRPTDKSQVPPVPETRLVAGEEAGQTA